MPWKESSVMEERLRFVARLLDGEGMSDVCRSFGISRKTGYKIFNRYKEHGLEALIRRFSMFSERSEARPTGRPGEAESQANGGERPALEGSSITYGSTPRRRQSSRCHRSRG